LTVLPAKAATAFSAS